MKFLLLIYPKNGYHFRVPRKKHTRKEHKLIKIDRRSNRQDPVIVLFGFRIHVHFSVLFHRLIERLFKSLPRFIFSVLNKLK